MSAEVVVLDSEGVVICGPTVIDQDPRHGLKIAISPRLDPRHLRGIPADAPIDPQVVWCDFEQYRDDGVAVLRRRDDFRVP